MTRESRRLLQKQLEELIANSIKQLRPLLQEEQIELGQEKLDKFHRENPTRRETVTAIYKRLRHPNAIEKPKFDTKKPCTHTKNQALFLEALGYEVPESIRKDYAVGYHIFPDGTEKIWCLICGQPWFPGEPGWNQAVRMLKESSNTKTTSEHVIDVRKQPEETKAVFFDKL